MKKIHVFLLVGASLLTFACQNNSTTTSSDAASSPASAAETAKPQAVDASQVKLICHELRNMDDISPLSEIILQIGDQKIIVDSASTCGDLSPDQWEGLEIPKDAKAAVGGWWAGAGDYYYLKIEGTDAVVMYGWSEEEAEEKDMYQYKEVKRASLMQ